MQLRRFVSLTLTVMLVLAAPAYAVQQDPTPRAVSADEIFSFKPQAVPLGPIEAEGLILDIGGGEGVISHLMGRQVVAIDVSLEKLSKRQVESLQIVMDARERLFVDGSFGTATAKVSGEAYRVLAPGRKTGRRDPCCSQDQG